MENLNKRYRNIRYVESLRYHTKEDWLDYPDIEEWVKEIVVTCSPSTCTHQAAMLKLIANVRHIIESNIPGEFVETGVFMGGSCMIIAEVLKHYKVYDRDIWMFDTFEGVPEPNDVETDPDGQLLKSWWNQNQKREGNTSNWCWSGINTVKSNMERVNYPGNIHYVKGMVEDTIPDKGPSIISLLRIDVDLEYPTRHVLEHFYNRISLGGHIIFDDYGHFPSVKHTVDDFFKNNQPNMYLDRVDTTVRHGVKV